MDIDAPNERGTNMNELGLVIAHRLLGVLGGSATLHDLEPRGLAVRRLLRCALSILRVDRQSGADLEIALTGQYPAEIVQPGQVCLPARQLFEIVSSLTESSIHLRKLPNDWVEILCGGSYFKVVGLSSEGFPVCSSIVKTSHKDCVGCHVSLSPFHTGTPDDRASSSTFS